MSELTEWAERELHRAGLFDEDSDYGGDLGPAILGCVKTFSSYGHSGGSAAISTAALERLLRWQPLTPLTDDPDEWMHVDAEMSGDATTWQSRRNPACFSRDGGKTYYNLDEPAAVSRRILRRLTRRRLPKMHRSLPTGRRHR